MTMGFGELIKKYRKENKLTQDKFGKMINRKQETISNYEKGIHFPIDAEEIKMIANVMGESVVTIVDSIQYSRNGVIEKNEAFLMDLEKESNIKALQQRYKFTMGDREITEAELKEALEFIKIKRMMMNKDDAN